MPRRPLRGGAARVGAVQSVAASVKWQLLRVFLTGEALKGNQAALHLLREMRGKPGQVEA